MRTLVERSHYHGLINSERKHCQCERLTLTAAAVFDRRLHATTLDVHPRGPRVRSRRPAGVEQSASFRSNCCNTRYIPPEAEIILIQF